MDLLIDIQKKTKRVKHNKVSQRVGKSQTVLFLEISTGEKIKMDAQELILEGVVIRVIKRITVPQIQMRELV